jgi:hypothetical protein
VFCLEVFEHLHSEGNAHNRSDKITKGQCSVKASDETWRADGSLVRCRDATAGSQRQGNGFEGLALRELDDSRSGEVTPHLKAHACNAVGPPQHKASVAIGATSQGTVDR